MSPTETKIELVTESIEALVLAEVIATNPACSEHERHIAVKNVRDARECLSKALKEFLAPTLRVVRVQDQRIAGAIERTVTRTTVEDRRPNLA